MKRIQMLAAVAVLAATSAAGASAAGNSRSVSTRPCGQDITWLKTSAQGDAFEIDGGNIAQGKSSSMLVRSLGERLKSDHRKSLSDALKLGERFGISVPTTPTPSEVWELHSIQTRSGTNFDVWYTALEVYDHHQDIQETSDEVKMGCSPVIRGDAGKELPMLRTHLKLSQQANAAVGGITK